MVNFFIPYFAEDIINGNPNRRRQFKQAISLFDSYIRHEKARKVRIKIKVEDIITKEDLEVIKITPIKKQMPTLKFYSPKNEPPINFSINLDSTKPYWDLEIDDFKYRIYKEPESEEDQT